jgi:hypothetical protein
MNYFMCERNKIKVEYKNYSVPIFEGKTTGEWESHCGLHLDFSFKRLGWKLNTLAYYFEVLITAVHCFIVPVPSGNVIKLYLCHS